MFLSKADTDAIEAQVAQIEKATDVQIVVAIVGKADAYVELPWKAFALGCSLAGLALVVADGLSPDWPGTHTTLLDAVLILLAGATCALATIYVPAFARLFLRTTRRDQEVRQFAQALFLRRELFKTQGRNGVLILTSMFERKVEILADVGLHPRVVAADWSNVVNSMLPLLRERRCFDAQKQGLSTMAAMLAAKGLPARNGANELPDRPIEEKGSH